MATDGDFVLVVVEPKKSTILFSGQFRGVKQPCPTVLKLRNPSPNALLWKIKCTCNILFRIRQPIGVLGPNDSVDVTIEYTDLLGQAPDDRSHYLTIGQAPAPTTLTQPIVGRKGEPTGTWDQWSTGTQEQRAFCAQTAWKNTRANAKKRIFFEFKSVEQPS